MVPIGSLATWTRTSWPSLSRSSMLRVAPLLRLALVALVVVVVGVDEQRP